MAKYVKLELTRSERTDIYIKLPDDFDESGLIHHKHQEAIAEIADDTTDRFDWDNSGWLDSVEVQSVTLVEESEAKQYCCGEWPK
jgi:hypothetical protein